MPFWIISQVLQEFGKVKQEQRYQRLKLLLDRSEAYARFLLERLQKRKAEDVLRRERDTRQEAKQEELKKDKDVVYSKKDSDKVSWIVHNPLRMMGFQ